MGRRIYHRRWDFQDGKWPGKEMGRPICHMTWDFQAGDGTSKMGSGRSRDGKTNFPQETWLPRWGVEGNEMGRRIYHRRCDVQDGKWQVMRWEDQFTTWHGTSKQEMGLPRWEVADHEMGRQIFHRRHDFQDGEWKVMRWGRRIYHRRCDVHDVKWQVMRWEDEFTTWHGTSKQEMGLPRLEVAGTEMGRRIDHRRWDFQAGDGTSKMGSGRQLRWEDEFTKGDGTSKIGRGRSWDGKTSLPQEMGRPRWEVAGNEMGRRTYHRRWDVQDGKWQVMEDEFTTGDGMSKMGSGR